MANAQSFTIAVLPGDGIGPEVMAESLRVLAEIGRLHGHTFEFKHGLVGGAAYEQHKLHFPDETKCLCEQSAAILFGSVGGPIKDSHLDKWKNCEANSILALRKNFQFYANFRPIRVYPELSGISPLRREVLGAGVDLLIIRELVGDIYFGEHKTELRNGKKYARDVAEYTEDQIRNVAHAAFRAAAQRRKKVTSVDKANVLDTSKLWREVVSAVGKEYPDIVLEHMLVDNCAMQLVRAPAAFDVILTSNMFGDILSDEAAVIPGSLGLTPSASFSASGLALYEPSGGSAPDIAGQDRANPIAQILSAAMMLRFSFQLQKEATLIENAVSKTLSAGVFTADIASGNGASVGTRGFTDQVLKFLSGSA